MMIRNYKSLIKGSRMRGYALRIANAGLEAIRTEAVIKKCISLQNNVLKIRDKEFNLADYRKIYVIGFGKASPKMALQLESVLKDKLKSGVVIGIQKEKTKRIKILKGTHPLPSQSNVKGTKEIIKLVSRLKKNDLVICVVSGGGSALLCSPIINLNEIININKSLLRSGATINEINIVRKHLSNVKGGWLARLVYPAKLVSIIFSDVVGDDLSVIASGTTVYDRTTVKDAGKVMRKYGLPKTRLQETLKDKKYFRNVKNILLLNSKVALDSMKSEALKLGLNFEVYSDSIQGEAREVGRRLVKRAKKGVLLAAGETTVTVRGNGKGGRNQELVLGALKDLGKGIVVLSISSDGQDNTDAAGAIADDKTAMEYKKKGLSIDEYLENNDSYSFFKKTKDLIFTGKTGTNVADFMVVVRE
jgi:glycerate-2-kinase